jgi:hypothetical protein
MSDPVCDMCNNCDDVQLCIVNREDVDLCAPCRERTNCGACGELHEDCLCDEDTAVDSEPYALQYDSVVGG